MADVTSVLCVYGSGTNSFVFLSYILKHLPFLYLDKANKVYISRAGATRNPKRKKEAHMCVFTCPNYGQVKHM